jgi:hypothetical protein
VLDASIDATRFDQLLNSQSRQLRHFRGPAHAHLSLPLLQLQTGLGYLSNVSGLAKSAQVALHLMQCEPLVMHIVHVLRSHRAKGAGVMC